MTFKELFKKYKSVLLYLFLGGLTTLVNAIVYYLCYVPLGWSNTLSTVLAWVVAVANAFLTNKPLVFESRDWRGKTVLKEFWRFCSCRIATGLLDLLLMFLLVDLAHLPGLPTKIGANILVVILNYLLSKRIVFKKK